MRLIYCHYLVIVFYNGNDMIWSHLNYIRIKHLGFYVKFFGAEI
jgi:hypothetical protein